MNSDDREFIEEAARRLDATLEELEAEEERLRTSIGEDRATELRAFWLGEFDDADMEEIRRGLDFDDRSLLWVWNRLHRNRDRRARAGRSAMILNAGRDDLDATPPKKND
ncbi:MAG: hypothetical protein AB7U61_05985 [Methylocystis sp.]